MTERERNGLVGLAAKLDPDHPDFSEFAVGIDITTLGLDLNSTEPLYKTFATPFGPANSSARPAIPDFVLPASYTVNNVPPLHAKLSSFSDDALFAVFYQNPRDVAQELAAQELYTRDWRWHMQYRQWMQKDDSFPPPRPISAREERGTYIFWDTKQWQKERVSD
jgi:CCR4-NOT transcription complex subunit 2